MSLEKLLEDKMIQYIGKDEEQINKKIKLAERDMKAAKDNLEKENYDWALAIAYNSMLQAGISLMYMEGYRPVGQFKHMGVIRFLHVRFGKEVTDKLIEIMDRLRKKRHKVVYEDYDIISVSEAEDAVRWAGEFILKVEEIIGD